MSVKITCDICGKEIHGYMDGGKFDYFDVCEDCCKKMEKLEDKWKEEKRLLFADFIAVNLRKPAKKEKPAPHTHVCKCKGGKPVAAVCKTKCGRAVRKANAPVPLGEVVKQLDKEEARKKKICGSSDIAKELGKRVSTISHYATANNIGKLKGTVRVYNCDEADMIRKHFAR